MIRHRRLTHSRLYHPLLPAYETAWIASVTPERSLSPCSGRDYPPLGGTRRGPGSPNPQRGHLAHDLCSCPSPNP